MYNYYMTSDGNWLSEDEYLAHWGLRKGQTKQNHKYLMKIGEGAKARYLYTQDEIRAFYNAGRQKVSNNTRKFLRKNISGYSEREKYKTAEKKYKAAEAQRSKSAAALIKGVNNANAAKKNLDNNPQSKKAQIAYNKALNEGKHAATRYYGNDRFKGDLDRANSASDEFIKARAAYNKTPLSKVENAVNDPIGTIRRATTSAVIDAEFAVKKPIDKVKEIYKERKSQKISAKIEKKMTKDPVVQRARNDVSKSQKEFSDARDAYLDYISKPTSDKNSPKWKKLEKEYKDTKSNYEFYSSQLERAERKYQK